MMRIVTPNTTYRAQGVRLAKRPGSLRGKTVGFLDGWGCREADGSYGMYPLMRELKRLLEEQHGITQSLWYKKSNVAQRAPAEQIDALIGQADVVINGEAA